MPTTLRYYVMIHARSHDRFTVADLLFSGFDGCKIRNELDYLVSQHVLGVELKDGKLGCEYFLTPFHRKPVRARIIEYSETHERFTTEDLRKAGIKNNVYKHLGLLINDGLIDRDPERDGSPGRAWTFWLVRA